ncbi:MAG: hypothetical protein U0821_04000 [Chloroflexota bacterium]
MTLGTSRRRFVAALAAVATGLSLSANAATGEQAASSDDGRPPDSGVIVANPEATANPPTVPAGSEVPTSPPPATVVPVPAPPPNVWAGTVSGVHPDVAELPARVYIPHENGGDVAVLDPATMQIIDRFWVGRTPHHVAPSWSMDRLWVNVMDSNQLTAIDPRTSKPVGTVPVAVPYNLYFTPDGSKAVVAAERFNRLDFYDPVTWAPIARLPIPGSGVDHLDFSADGSYLLVSCEFGGQMVKVDVVTPRVLGVVQGGGLPVDVKLAPAGDLFYVASQGRHGLVVVDPEAMREVDFIPTARGCHGLAISRDAKYLYIANRLAGSYSVLEFATRSIVAHWQVGGSPDMLQVSPLGDQLWASDRYHGTISVVDTSTGQLLHRVRTGAAPHGLTYFPQPGRYSIGHNGVYR